MALRGSACSSFTPAVRPQDPAVDGLSPSCQSDCQSMADSMICSCRVHWIASLKRSLVLFFRARRLRARKGAGLMVSLSCPTQNTSRVRGKSPGPAQDAWSVMHPPSQGHTPAATRVASTGSLALVSIPAVCSFNSASPAHWNAHFGLPHDSGRGSRSSPSAALRIYSSQRSCEWLTGWSRRPEAPGVGMILHHVGSL
jgi:hypothetical protein